MLFAASMMVSGRIEVDMFILPFEVLFDEEVMVGGSGGRSTWSLVYVCAQGDQSEACVDILKPFFFNDTDIYTVTLVNFHLRAKLCKKSQSKNL